MNSDFVSPSPRLRFKCDFKKWLLNFHFLSAVLISFLVLFVFNLLLATNQSTGKQSQQSVVSLADQTLSVAIKNKQKTLQALDAERFNFDLHPSGARAGGTVQALINGEGTRIRQDVSKLTSTPDSPLYNIPQEVAYSQSKAEALKLAALAQTGKGAALRYIDPSDGKVVEIAVSPQLLTLISVNKLAAINAAESKRAIQDPNLAEVTKDISSQESDMKYANMVLLQSQERGAVVKQLAEQTIYGEKASSEQRDFAMEKVESMLQKFKDSLENQEVFASPH
jgi:hypothetical protein